MAGINRGVYPGSRKFSHSKDRIVKTRRAVERARVRFARIERVLKEGELARKNNPYIQKTQQKPIDITRKALEDKIRGCLYYEREPGFYSDFRLEGFKFRSVGTEYHLELTEEKIVLAVRYPVERTYAEPILMAVADNSLFNHAFPSFRERARKGSDYLGKKNYGSERNENTGMISIRIRRLPKDKKEGAILAIDFFDMVLQPTTLLRETNLGIIKEIIEKLRVAGN